MPRSRRARRTRRRRRTRLNLRLLLILGLIGMLLAGGVVGGHYLRKQAIARDALRQADHARSLGDFYSVAKHLKRYLHKYPNDLVQLEQYADAHMRVRPLRSENIGSAIGAYRRLVRLDPGRHQAYRELASLYAAISDFQELAHVARLRLRHEPAAPEARLWLGSAYVAQRRYEEAGPLLEQLAHDLEPSPEHASYFADACIQLSRLAELRQEPLERAIAWLDRAHERDPRNPEVLARRARLSRLALAGAPPERYAALREAAIADLRAVDALEFDRPRVRLFMSQEWLEHEQLDRAEAELAIAAAQSSSASLRDAFLRPEDWNVLLFVQRVAIDLARGDPDAAAARADEILAALSAEAQRHVVLAAAVEAYAAGGRVADARRCLAEYRQAIVLLPGGAGRYEETAALLAAVVARADRQPYRVIAGLEPFVDREVARPKVLKLLGEAYIETGQSRRALRALRKYLQHRPGDAEVSLQLVRECMNAGQWTAAIELAHTARQRFATLPEATLLHAEALLRAADGRTPPAPEQLDLVAADLQRLRAADPDNPDVRLLLAALALQRDDVQAAERALRDAIAELPDAASAELMLARVLHEHGRPDEALALVRARCAETDEARPWVLLADLLEDAGAIDEARTALEQAIETLPPGPEQRTARICLAALHLDHGQRAAGIALLRALADADPADVHIRSVLLDVPEVRADEPLAAQLIAEIRAIEGDAGLLWRAHQAAAWLAQPGQWRQRQGAIRAMLEYCVDADPGWPAPVLLLAQLHDRRNTPEQMESIYRRTLAVNPAAAAVAERLLALLEKQQRYADARDVLDQFGATAGIAPERRASVFIAGGALDDAIEHLRTQIAADENDVRSRVLLARLSYAQSGDAEHALGLLDEAERIEGPSAALAGARAEILLAAGRTDEARRTLDEQVERDPSLDAYLARAALHARLGALADAERDYRRIAELSPDARGYGWLGQFLLEAGRVDEALAAWERGLAAYPDDDQLARRMVPPLLRRGGPGDKQRAAELLGELERRFGDDPGVLWLRSLAYAAEGTPAALREAEGLMRQVTELEPGAVDASLSLIDMYMQRGDYAAARATALQAQGVNPASTRLLLARARAEIALDNHALALELTRAALRARPNDRDVRTVFAEVALNAGRSALIQEALDLVRDAIAESPHDEQLQRAAARLLDAGGRTADAIEQLSSFTAALGDEAGVEVTLLLAELHFKTGDRTTAGRLTRAAMRRAPDDPRARRALVLWLAAERDYAAIAELVDGLALARQDELATAGLAASIFGATDDPALKRRGADLYTRILEIEPAQVDARLGLALLRFQEGRADEAIALYQAVLAQQPDNPRALNDLAWVLATERDALDEALRLIDRAIQRDASNAHLWDTRGEILQRIPGRAQDARTCFEKCVELAGPRSATGVRARLKLAQLCQRLNDPAHVRAYAEDALKIDREHGVLSREDRQVLAHLLNINPHE